MPDASVGSGSEARADAIRRARIGSFFDALTQGAFPHDLFAPDACFWTTASGPVDPGLYLRVPAMLASIFPYGLAFTIDSLILEGDRAAAEVRSHGRFDGDQVYANSYAFLFRFDGDRIASVAEHFNPLRVPPTLAERMRAGLAG